MAKRGCPREPNHPWISLETQRDGVQTPWTSYIHRRYRGRARRGVDKKWLTLHPSPRRSPHTGTRCSYAVLHCYTIAYATLCTAQNIFGVAPSDGQRRGSVVVTLPTVSVLHVRFPYTVWRHITLTHAMLRYVTLPHAVYGVCTSSRCVCTQLCGVNFRTAYEKVVDRSIFHSSLLTFPKFHLLCCSSVAPLLSSSSLGSAV